MPIEVVEFISRAEMHALRKLARKEEDIALAMLCQRAIDDRWDLVALTCITAEWHRRQGRKP